MSEKKIRQQAAMYEDRKFIEPKTLNQFALESEHCLHGELSMKKENPRRCDILFGRGSDCWNHCGNKKFRRIIAKYQEKYHSMKRRTEKVALVAEIVEEIRSSGARFLRRNGESHLWEEVDRKTTVDKVGHAIRDKKHVTCRKRVSTENSSTSIITEVRNEDYFIQSRETNLDSNPYLRPILSQGQYQRMNFQLQDSIISNSHILNRREQDFSIPHGWYATYNHNLLSGLNVDGSIIPNHSYLQQGQQGDTPYVGDLALSIPILRGHRHDGLQGNDIIRQLGERISNALLRSSSLESHVLANIRDQVNVNTSRLSTIGLSTLRRNTFSDRTLSTGLWEGSPSYHAERYIHSLHCDSTCSPITILYDPL